jgi:ribonuclease HI
MKGSTGVQRALFESTDAPQVTAYTDGGCDPNPGPGGWAAILALSEGEVVLSGSAQQTTNNQMELEAAIGALAYLLGRYGPCCVELYTDSQYLQQGITSWIDDWFARSWRTKNGQPVKNQVLWQRLYELTHQHTVDWHWVRGHTGNAQNERADALATAARQRLSAPQGSDLAPLPSAAPEDLAQAEISIGVSCRGSSGVGGWAAVVESPAGRQVLRDRTDRTTSNQLYLAAATQALRALEGPHRVTLRAPSDYLVRGASEWVLDWQQRGWHTAGGAAVKNQAEWQG